MSEIKGKLDDDVDALYALPLSEFTAGRNALAARLKQGGQRNEADFVKSLGKPSISAWAVNQLYWQHRKAFDRLIETGERVRQAQTSHSARKMADMRGPLDARREALSNISDLASALLQDAGHNPTLDTMRRIASTLEAMSIYASIPDGPRPGRLTNDIDPPGFESLASFSPDTGMRESSQKAAQVSPSQKSGQTAQRTRRKDEQAANVRQLEETRHAKIAKAKVTLQDAKKLLTEARAKAHSLEAAKKKADAEAQKAEQERRDAEQSLKEAKAASEDAARHARSIKFELDDTSKEVKDAERTVEKASRELESLFRELPGK